MKKVAFLENELWWGGAAKYGKQMPYSASTDFDAVLAPNSTNNQANPVLISNKGRYFWCEEGFNFSIHNGEIIVEEKGNLVFGETGGGLKEAFREVKTRFFPDDNKLPNTDLIVHPQYNTWIELMYDQCQEKILAYVDNLVANDMPKGVIMIDDTWQENYGVWNFNPVRFSDPKAMMDKIHSLGYKIMLWICPFVSPDSAVYRELTKRGLFVKNPDGTDAIRHWWNGYSAVLDFTNPDAQRWFKDQLDRLQNEYGVDGFKFDAGDAEFYRDDDLTFAPTTANGQCELYAKIGLDYELNEYRACWKLAGQPLVQRLADKRHAWERDGMDCLIPNSLAQSLLGYRFICPDMIGGGEFQSFLDGAEIDEELFVRYAQASALMPMMQFSADPFRVLSKENAELCKDAALLHERTGAEILMCVKEAIENVDPVIAPICYYYPGEGEQETTTFMYNENILVAPVVSKQCFESEIYLPTGEWVGFDGNTYTGGKKVKIKTPIECLPFFCKD